MSRKSQASEESDPRAIESNPLFMLEIGRDPPSVLPRHRMSAAVGNLFFEYVSNVPRLRGIVRSGRQVAEYLESKNLITWHRDTDRYTWLGEPLTRAEFLDMLRPVNPAMNH